MRKLSLILASFLAVAFTFATLPAKAGSHAIEACLITKTAGAEAALAAEFQARLEALGGARAVNLNRVGDALRERTQFAREMGGDAVQNASSSVKTAYSDLSQDHKLIGQIIAINVFTLVLFLFLFR
jgi:hypothetical protein